MALGVMGSDVPTAVALSAKRMRYAVLPGRLASGGGGGLSERCAAVVPGTAVLADGAHMC